MIFSKCWMAITALFRMIAFEVASEGSFEVGTTRTLSQITDTWTIQSSLNHIFRAGTAAFCKHRCVLMNKHRQRLHALHLQTKNRYIKV